MNTTVPAITLFPEILPGNNALAVLVVLFMLLLSSVLIRRKTNQMWLSVIGYMWKVPAPIQRKYTTNNRQISDEHSNKFHPRLRTIFQQLDCIAPRFTLRHGDIEILDSPTDFYEGLKERIASAQNRIFLSSLYVGKAQTELVECLDKALEKKPSLTVSILTDALRGTREAPENTCSALLMVPLVEKFGKHRVDIRMYHTPHLSGLQKTFTPKRLNETYGLQHMKLYGFDDEIILSGANLSQDYFTDRQDRYYVFRSAKLTDYYWKIHSAIALVSYQVINTNKLKQGFRLTWPTSNKSCEPHMNVQRFLSDTSHMLEPLLTQHELSKWDEFNDQDEFDTIVYPVSQFTPLFHAQNDMLTEKPAVLRLLLFLDLPKIQWWFTAGYFNMLPDILERLVNGKAKGSVITASPKANSFYKSAGVSYYIPEAYLLFAKRFLELVHRMGKDALITVYEWQNGVVNTPGGWLYHAKGLWVTVPDEKEPSITVVGLSNYTKRAYLLDLESNAIIITKDEALKHAMKAEIENLMTHANKLELKDFEKPKDEAHAHVENERHILMGVQLAVKLLGGRL